MSGVWVCSSRDLPPLFPENLFGVFARNNIKNELYHMILASEMLVGGVVVVVVWRE